MNVQVFQVFTKVNKILEEKWKSSYRKNIFLTHSEQMSKNESSFKGMVAFQDIFKSFYFKLYNFILTNPNKSVKKYSYGILKK